MDLNGRRRSAIDLMTLNSPRVKYSTYFSFLSFFFSSSFVLSFFLSFHSGI